MKEKDFTRSSGCRISRTLKVHDRAPDEGCGGTLPPHCPPAHARAASASTAARLIRHPALASAQTAGAVLLVRATRPALDAGVLRHYIAEYFKERGTTAEG